MSKAIFYIFGIFMITTAQAQIKATSVEYSSKGAKMEGYVAYDESNTGPKPGILIVHDWMGLGDFAKEKAKKLAKDGYIAFAADIYGKGIRPANTEEAAKLATHYKENRKSLRDRIRAAYDTLIAMKNVDPKKVVVMGYCFGGTTALELARSGASLVGTVSFHGGLSSPTPEDAGNINGRVLALHGADDPFVPPPEVAAFKDEMSKAAVPMEFVTYPGAVHSFTNPQAGHDKSKGAAYNAAADKKSWSAFQKFLKQVSK